MKAAWEEYWYGAVAAARPYLLIKSFLILLAFDCWLVTLDHGGKYGAGGFNVAHFGWLDAIQPIPSPGLYLGTLLLVGLLAFVLAFCGATRIGLLVLCGLYTYSWAMSMLDSYQHHYLISLVLLCFAFFPQVRGTDLEQGATGGAVAKAAPVTKAKKKKQAREAAKAVATGAATVMTSAWAYVLVLFTAGVVYSYTGISKTEPDWRAGSALREITCTETFGPEDVRPADTWEAACKVTRLQGLEDWYVDHGGTKRGFWGMMGASVILLQIVIALGYFIAARRDTMRVPVMVIYSAIACFAALNFHIGAEWLELRIGWFSFYMIALPLIAFLPARWLELFVWALRWPMLQAFAALKAWKIELGEDTPAVSIGIAAGAAAIVVLMGVLVDVPGAVGAGIALGLGVVGWTVWLVTKKEQARARPYVIAAAVGALAMWLSIAASEVRYDFYRYMGGDARRRGEIDVAIEAYEKAARYAPEGKWTAKRQRRLDELRARRARGEGTLGGDDE